MACDGGHTKLVFLAEWFQKEANMSRSFYLYYFPADNTVEIFDHRAKKLFLRRTKVANYSASHFFVGAKLHIYGRQFDLVDSADTPTRARLASTRERTFCLLMPPALRVMDQILRRLANFSLANCLMLRLDGRQAAELCASPAGGGGGGDATAAAQLQHLQSGAVLALELIAPNAVQTLCDLCGPASPAAAKAHAPCSLRAIYGVDEVNNYVLCSGSPAEAERQLALVFPGDRRAGFAATVRLQNSTLAVVKPHAVHAGQLGDICAAIYDGGLHVTAMRMFSLERECCEEFYEVYRGVVPEYLSNVLELSNGPCVAMEVQGNGAAASAYAELRKLCGPADAELAKQLRPSTIRARFGVSKVQNAIHCTDLEEDTRSELEYFFKILA